MILKVTDNQYGWLP